MFGTFSLSIGENSLDDSSNRMRKVWLLLAYLIFTRNRRVSQEDYISLLQGFGDESSDPSGRMKAVFYRARGILDGLGDGMGHELIIRKAGTYAWNTDYPLQLDIDEFEKLCAIGAQVEETRLENYLRALELYKGDFLQKLSMEHWVIPIATYYHQMYLEVARQTLDILTSEKNWKKAEEICRRALKIEPYSEELYKYLMRCLIAQEQKAAALSIYDEMSELLFSTFGVIPTEESRKLYREASKEIENFVLPAGTIGERLREPDTAKGALYCEYDFFKFLYQVQARSLIRSGETVHIALITVHSQNSQPLARRSLDKVMENLKEIICTGLRQGDVFTMCSISQFIIMLPQANYENSETICRRLIKAFCRKYPHSPANINYRVQPLEPLMPENHSS